MAQLSTLQNHLQDCAGLADKYNQLLQQLPAGSFPGANLPPIQFAPLVPAGGTAAGAATPRKRKSKAGDDGPEPEDGRRRRKKKVREEGQPKRPPSAYLFFQNEVRSQLKAAHPFTPHHELLGMISKQWSTMTPEQKKVRVVCVRTLRRVLTAAQPYEDRQKGAKETYETEIDAFNLATGKPARVRAHISFPSLTV
jgi:hypothetical protein